MEGNPRFLCFLILSFLSAHLRTHYTATSISFLFDLEMEACLEKLRSRFPTLPKDVLRNIYRCRLERVRTFGLKDLPEDVRWMIEAKVRLSGELHNLSDKRMPGMGRSSYSKKRRAKRMGVCHRCARWNCNKHCRSKGMVSVNREDKIKFIKDGLSKESLDDIIQTLETHPSGEVHVVLLDLFKLFNAENERYSLGDLTLKDPVCQFIRKLDGKQILDL